MVEIALPPPNVLPAPNFFVPPKGTKFLRLFNPASYGAHALTFRHFGPLKRFDHQRLVDSKPQEDPDRGIVYAGETLSGCIVEIFGDSRVIQVDTWEVAQIETSRELSLLDLRADGAMKAGTVAAVCKDSNHGYSQEWSKYFYEQSFVYTKIDGLIYGNAHNDEFAYALYERCQSALTCIGQAPLKADSLRVEIQCTAAEFNLTIIPY